MSNEEKRNQFPIDDNLTTLFIHTNTRSSVSITELQH